MKKYTEKEFEDWCERNFVEDDFGLWDFIKDEEVELKLIGENFSGKEMKADLLIKVKLGE